MYFCAVNNRQWIIVERNWKHASKGSSVTRGMTNLCRCPQCRWRPCKVGNTRYVITHTGQWREKTAGLHRKCMIVEEQDRRGWPALSRSLPHSSPEAEPSAGGGSRSWGRRGGGRGEVGEPSQSAATRRLAEGKWELAVLWIHDEDLAIAQSCTCRGICCIAPRLAPLVGRWTELKVSPVGISRYKTCYDLFCSTNLVREILFLSRTLDRLTNSRAPAKQLT